MLEEKRSQTLVESEFTEDSDGISEAERRLLRKCDRHTLPILFCLLIIAFMSI